MRLSFVQVLPDDARERGITDERCFAPGRDAAGQLIRAYLRELGEDLSFQHIEEELANLPGEYGPPLGALFIAWREDEPVAVGGLRPMPHEAECEIKRLYVSPAARGTGLGRTTLELLLDAAKNLGYARAVLDTLDRLEAANRLYDALGFEEIASYNGNPLPGVRFFAKTL